MRHSSWYRFSWIAILSAISCTSETYSTLRNPKETEANEDGSGGKSTSSASSGTFTTSSKPIGQGGTSEAHSEATTGKAIGGSSGTLNTTEPTLTGGTGATAIGGAMATGGAHTGGQVNSGGAGFGGSTGNTATNTTAGSKATGGQTATGGISATGGTPTAGSAGRSATGGNGSAGQAGGGPFPPSSWCPASRAWQGCDASGRICPELITNHPYYITNSGGSCTLSSSACAGSYSTCGARCATPWLNDTIDATNRAACDGVGQWNGCRGSGCTACVQMLVNYPNYFNNHLNCKPSCTCGDDGYTTFFPCSANCPPPTDADK